MGNSTSHANGPNGPGSGALPQGPSSAQGGHHRRATQSQSPRRPSPSTRPSTGAAGTTNYPSTMAANGAQVGGGGSISGRPIKSKKKSLELPDLNLNNLSSINPAPQRIHSQLPSAPIPIPSGAGGGTGNAGSGGGGGTGATAAAGGAQNNDANAAAGRQAGQNRGISDDALAAGPSSLVVPPPPLVAPASKISSNASFGRKEKRVPKRQKHPYPERVVKSMLYSGVPTNHDGIVNVIAPAAAPKVQVQLLYPGQAESVYVSGTYEPSWDIRTELHYDEAKRMWSTQVQVAPAAYHIKFLVDGVWKTSDALPLATDSGGRLVNYIDVRTKGPEIKEWGKDWWGVGTEDEEDQEQGAWTTMIPPYLETAAALEEREETLRRNQAQSPTGHHARPRRILPTPPQLPRHLDKVILNARVPTSTGTSGREGRSSSVSGQSGSGDNPRGRTSHPSQGAWPSPMTGISPSGGHNPAENGSQRRRDSGGSGGSADRGPGSGAVGRSRRGSSSLDVGVYGGLIVSEGGGMTGFGAGIGSPIGDDNSVLPLPSHSVVNHLATSAIRNGVLAVATTTRYKAKYISTVYYRPTHPEDSPEESGVEMDDNAAGAGTMEPIRPNLNAHPIANGAA
ncbi:hypothetical protein CPB86DRAFT_289513 [Serendipita vermifera]|nr:hypothetical protein CPB86DRAFT_289513 [Serendipita vermifera]